MDYCQYDVFIENMECQQKQLHEYEIYRQVPIFFFPKEKNGVNMTEGLLFLVIELTAHYMTLKRDLKEEM